MRTKRERKREREREREGGREEGRGRRVKKGSGRKRRERLNYYD